MILQYSMINIYIYIYIYMYIFVYIYIYYGGLRRPADRPRSGPPLDDEAPPHST